MIDTGYIPMGILLGFTFIIIFITLLIIRSLIIKGRKKVWGYVFLLITILVSLMLQYNSRKALDYAQLSIDYKRWGRDEGLKDKHRSEFLANDIIITLFGSILLGGLILGTAKKREEDGAVAPGEEEPEPGGIDSGELKENQIKVLLKASNKESIYDREKWERIVASGSDRFYDILEEGWESSSSEG